HDDRAFVTMIAVAYGIEAEPRVERFSSDGRGDSQRSDVSRACRALDLGHQQLADTPGLNVGGDEDRTDDASVEACCSNDAAANDGDKNGALPDQLEHS